MLIPINVLKKYVDINTDINEFVKNFSLKSAEVDSFGPSTTRKEWRRSQSPNNWLTSLQQLTPAHAPMRLSHNHIHPQEWGASIHSQCQSGTHPHN